MLQILYASKVFPQSDCISAFRSHSNMYNYWCVFGRVCLCCWAIDRPGMQLSAAIVVFAASFPHAVVRNPVGPLHTEHQVLDEGNLHTENTNQTQEGNKDYLHTNIQHLRHTQLLLQLDITCTVSCTCTNSNAQPLILIWVEVCDSRSHWKG